MMDASDNGRRRLTATADEIVRSYTIAVACAVALWFYFLGAALWSAKRSDWVAMVLFAVLARVLGGMATRANYWRRHWRGIRDMM